MLKSSGAMAAANAHQPGAGDGARDGLCGVHWAAARSRAPLSSRSRCPTSSAACWARARSPRLHPIFKQKEVKEGETEMCVLPTRSSRADGCRRGGDGGGGASASPSRWLPGSSRTKTRLMLRLLRLMFPYMLLVCLAAVFIGMANARGHFFVPALGRCCSNVIMIASVLVLAPRWGAPWRNRSSPSPSGIGGRAGPGLLSVADPSREGYRYE